MSINFLQRSKALKIFSSTILFASLLQIIPVLAPNVALPKAHAGDFCSDLAISGQVTATLSDSGNQKLCTLTSTSTTTYTKTFLNGILLHIIISGAKGGDGGADGAVSGKTGGSGATVNGDLTDDGSTWSFCIGSAGGNGASSVGGSGAGSAGTNSCDTSFNGGSGGNAGNAGSSGAGGGGGAATLVKKGTNIVGVAGGGGGGAGGSNSSSNTNGQSGTGNTGGNGNTHTGGTGGVLTNGQWCISDGPGGGGGGGGSNGTTGGGGSGGGAQAGVVNGSTCTSEGYALGGNAGGSTWGTNGLNQETQGKFVIKIYSPAINNPTISGTPNAGVQLSATLGTATNAEGNAGTLTSTNIWQRDASCNGTWADTSNTSLNLTPSVSDIGACYRIKQTSYDGRTSIMPTIAYSSATAVVGNNPQAITYAAGGGAGTAPSSPTSVPYQGTFTTPANPYLYGGYSFAGWSNGTTTYPANVTYPSTGSVTAPVTLTATWTANQWVIWKNGDSSDTTTTSITYANSDVIDPTASTWTLRGYTYSGLCTTRPAVGSTCNSGTRYNVGEKLAKPASPTVNLYTVWLRTQQSALTVSATNSSANYTGTAFSASPAFSTSGGSGTGAVTYAIFAGGTASGCALSSSAADATLTATSTGTCFIKATKASDADYDVMVSATYFTFTFNPTLPGVPTNLSAQSNLDSKITLTWTPPSNTGGTAITDYLITYTYCVAVNAHSVSCNGVRITYSHTATGSVNTYDVTGLTNGYLYGFQISAINSVGTGNATTDSNLASPSKVPGVPTGLAVTSVGDGQISISWTKPTDEGGSDISDYAIQYSTNGTTWTTFSHTASTATSATVTGLTNGTGYSFRVAAINESGTGTYTAGTSSSASPASTLSKAANPTVTATSGTTTSLTVTFTPDAGAGSTTLNLYSAATGGSAISTKTSATSGATFTGLTANTQYWVTATSIGNGSSTLTGAESDRVSATTNQVAQNPTLSPSQYQTGQTSYLYKTASQSLSIAPTISSPDGGTLTYQWRFQPKSGVYADISGATSASYSINSLQTSDEGTYFVRVTNTINGTVATVASGTIYVYVYATPTLATPSTGLSGTINSTFTTLSLSAVGGYQVLSSVTCAVTTGSLPTGLSISKYDASTCRITGTPTVAGTFPIVVTYTDANGITASTNSFSLTISDQAPNAPTISSITAGNQSLSVAFTAGTNAGTAITKYQYSTDGSTWADRTDGGTTASPIVITKVSSDGTTLLTNGISYSVRIRAVNTGNGSASTATSATPFTTPSAPTSLSATPGNAQVSISFTAGANGGYAITNYEYSTDGSSWTALSPAVTSSPVTITGLTNGTSYNIYLRAVSSKGSGASSTSVSATLATVAGAPTGVSATSNANGQSVVSWTAPASNGGASITDYTVQYSSDGTNWNTFTHTASTSVSMTVTGLTNGTAYTFKVAAVNAQGTGSFSTVSSSAIPSTVPGAPTSVLGTNDEDARSTVSWTAPFSNGGAAIAYYTVLYSSGGAYTVFGNTSDGSTTTLVVTGLTNGTSYTFAVKAHNASGDSTQVVSALSYKPKLTIGAASAPTVSATNGLTTQIDISFTVATGADGMRINLYTTATGGTPTTFDRFNGTSYSWSGLTAGTDYWVSLIGIPNLANAGSTLNGAESSRVKVTTNSALAPIITTQPVNITRTYAQTETFSVVATSPDGGTLSYQWQKNGSNIVGATSDTYTSVTRNITGTDGPFTVIITNLKNGISTSVTSNSVNATYSAQVVIGATTYYATAGSPYSQQVSVSGGLAPYTFSAFTGSCGTWPSWLSISSSGLLTGTPTASANYSNLCIQVYDANYSPSNIGISISQSNQFNLNVSAAMTYAASGTQSATINSAYSQNFAVTGGRATVTYAITSGTLPAGLSLSGSTISGTPTSNGTTTVTLTATDANSATKDLVITFTVSNAAAVNASLGTATATADGFTSQINSYNAATYTYTITTSAGSVSVNGTGLITVTGLAPNTSATVTVKTDRTGYNQGSSSVTGKSLYAAQTPNFGSVTRTVDGFIVSISNYNSIFTWPTPTVTAGSVSAPTIQGSNLATYTVTGLTPGQSATLTVTNTRSDWVSGTASVAGSALAATSISVTDPGAQTYGTAVTLTATAAQAGSINFQVGGVTISGCGTKSVTASPWTATCSWTPSTVGTVTLTAVFTPTDSTNYASQTSSGVSVTVSQTSLSTPTVTIVAVSASSTSLTATITHATNSTGTYIVAYNAATGGTVSITGATTATGTTSVSFTGLSAGTTYYFEYYAVGNTNYSNSATNSTRVAVSTNAVWTVTYNYNSATSGNTTASATYISGATSLTLPAPLRTNYTFGGWYSDSNFTTSVGTTTYTPTGTVNLYAKWTGLSFTITYKAGTGATGTDIVDSYTFGQTVTYRTGSSTGFTRAAYTLDYWTNIDGGSAKSADFGDPYSGSTNVVVYARWTVITYNISYNANGGSPTDLSAHTGVYQDGQASSSFAAATITSKTGYTLTSWNTAADGSGRSFTPGSTKTTAGIVAVGATTFVLYAQYTVNSYTLAFDSQGGTTLSNSTFTYNQSFASPTAPTKLGYTFGGWALTSGGAALTFPYTSTATSTLTLYALWNPVTYNVTFDSQGGSTVNASTYSFGSSIASPTAPTKSGYGFTGWSLTSGGTKITMPYTPGTPGDITLYALWTASPTFTSIDYNYGLINGSYSRVITGTNLNSVTAITVDGKTTTLSAQSSTSITFTSNGTINSVGAKDIVFTYPGGTVTASGAITIYDTPIVSSISPTSATTDGGTTITVTGSKFTGATSAEIYLGGFTFAVSSFTVVSDTSITFVSGYVNPGNSWSVRVKNPAASGILSAGATKLTVTVPAPVISTQPTAVTAVVGDSVTFSVVATAPTDGGSLAYQWYSGGSAVNGATSSTYTFTAASTTNTSVYVAIKRITYTTESAATNSNTVNLTVTGKTQTLTFTSNSPTSATTNGTGYSPAATTNATGGTFTIGYSASPSSVCTYNINNTPTVAFVGPGTCTITASQAGNTTWASATATQTFSVAKAVVALSSFAAVTKTYGDAAFTLTAPTKTPSSVAGAFTYDSANTSVATVSGSTVTVVGVGTSLITATYNPTDTTNYDSSTVTMTLTVNGLAISTPSAPSVVATAGTLKSIGVTWVAATGATSYTAKIYNSTPTLVKTVTGLSGTSTTITDSSWTDGAAYTVTITAIGGGNYADSVESPKSTATNLSKTITVTFSNNYGTAITNTSTYITGGSLSLIANTGNFISRNGAGMVFSGWYTDPTNGSKMTFPYNPSETSNFTLYAHWSPLTGSYSKDGGTSQNFSVDQSMPSIYITAPQSFALNSTTSLSGATGFSFRIDYINYLDSQSGNWTTGASNTNYSNSTWSTSTVNKLLFQLCASGTLEGYSFSTCAWAPTLYIASPMAYSNVPNQTIHYGNAGSIALSGYKTGGRSSYTYSIASGTLPAWASLNASTGAIAGTPNAVGTSTISVKITDANGASVTTNAFDLVSDKGTPTLTTLSNQTKVFGSGTFTITNPTASPTGGTFAYSSSDTTVASISGNTVTLVGVGTATITATYTPSDTTNYNNVTTTFTLQVTSGSIAQPNAPNVVNTPGVLHSLDITWSAATGASTYTAYIYDNASTPSLIKTITGLTGTSATLSDNALLTDDTTFKVSIKAIAGANYSDSVESLLSTGAKTAKTYTISYNSNSATSGTAPTGFTYVTGASAVAVSSNSGSLARTGFTFAGWYTTSTGAGGTDYAAGSSTYNTAADATLYAKWTALVPTITSFVSTSLGTTSVPYGDTVTVTGTNFSGATSVTIGGVAVVSFTVVSATSLTFTSNKACCTVGKVAITTPGGIGTSVADLTPLPQLPVITTQPADAIKNVGDSVTFTVVAAAVQDGGTLSYQWKKGTNTISGATGASYTFTTTALTDAANYSVIVTNTISTNSSFTVSNNAALTMNKGNQAALTITSTSGTYGTPLTLTYSGGTTSGAVTFTTASTDCSIAAGVLTVAHATTCVVSATMSGNTNYNDVTSSNTNVVMAARAITLTAGNITTPYTGSAVVVSNTVSMTSGTYAGSDLVSGATFTYSASSPSYNSTTAPTAVGTYTITPSIATFSTGTATDYNITYVAGTLTIGNASQTITNVSTAPANAKYEVTSYTISATGSAGGSALVYGSSTTSVCTVDSTTGVVTLKSFGTCTLTINQPATTGYNAATQVTQTFTVGKSNVVTLGSASFNFFTLSPAFSSGTTTYNQNISAGMTSATLSAAATSGYATLSYSVNGVSRGALGIQGSGSTSVLSFAFGTTTISVVVTAQDGTTTQTYTFALFRPSNDATLSALSTSAGAISFVSATDTYALTVANSVSSITVTPTVNDANSTVQVAGVSVTSGTASGPVAISESITYQIVTIKVTAQDGTIKYYYLRITRPFAVSSLTGLTVAGQTLSPTFASGTLAYSTTVTSATSTISFTPDWTASVLETAAYKLNGEANWNALGRGAAATPSTLLYGDNTLQIMGTAQDGSTTTYTVTITRTKLTQSITFTQPSNVAYTVNGTVSLTATSSASLTVAFTSTTTSVCSVTGSTVTILSVGTCTIAADQAGDSTYSAATQSSKSFSITTGTQATLSISASTTSATYTGSAYTATPTFSTSGGSGSGAVTYAITTGGTASTCALSDNTSTGTLTATTSGTCFVTATKAADSNFASATSTYLTFTFNKLALTAPANPAATPVDGYNNQIAVTWTAVANASSYSVSLYDASGTYISGQSVSSSATSYTYTGLTTGTTYKFTVKTFGTGNYSNSSESAFASATAHLTPATPSLGLSYKLDNYPSVTITGNTLIGVTIGQILRIDGNTTVTDSAAPKLSFTQFKNGVSQTSSILNSPSIIFNDSITAAAYNVGSPTGYTSCYPGSATGNFFCIRAGALLDTVSSYSSYVGIGLDISPTITFTQPAAQTGVVGTTFTTFTPQVTGGKGPYTFEIVSTPILPQGLNMDPTTGVISGTPTTSGSFGPYVRVGDANGYGVTKQILFTISGATQTITFTKPADATYGDAPITLSPTSSSALTVALTSATTSVCTVSGLTVTIVAPGTCTLNANQAGNTAYAAASQVSQSFTVNKATQATLNIASSLSTAAYTGSAFTAVPSLSTTGGSGASGVIYAIVSGGTATGCNLSANTAGATLTATSVGTCFIAATKATDTNYLSATSANLTFTFTSTSQTITFTSPANITYGATPSALVATASSALTVTFTSNSTSICTVSGTTITLVSSGTCSISADQAGNSNYAAAPQVIKTFTVSKATPVLSTLNAVTKNYGDAAFTVTDPTVTGSIAGAFTYSSGTTSVATVSGNSVTPLIAGQSVITALFTPTDTGKYNTATVTFTLTVAARGIAQPNAPAVTATAGVLKSIAVTWTSVANAVAYTLKIYASDGTTLLQTIPGLSGTSKTVTATDFATIADNTGYKIGIIATGDANNADSLISTLSSLITTNKSYTISYNANGSTGGSAPANGTWITGATATNVAANTGSLVRSGYSFAGWNTAANGNGSDVAASGSATYSTAADITLYAKWTANGVVVTYKSDYASGPVDVTETKTADLAFNLRTNTFTRTGYNFAGWAATSGGTLSKADSASVTLLADATYYALWTAINYTVTYNGNSNTGGSVPTDSGNYNIGGSVTVKSNSGSLVRTGYSFNGWTDDSGNTGTLYLPGTANTTYTVGSSNITFYAKWSKDTYFIAYDAQGGSAVLSSSYQIGDTVTLAAGPTKTGYTFAGWATTVGGTSVGLTYAPPSIGLVTLYAKWTAINYRVYYSGNNNTSGTVPSDANNYNINSTVTVLGNTANAARTGYTWAGWNTAADGSGTTYQGAATFTMGSADINLYAKWTPINYTITYNGNGLTSGSVPTDSGNYNIGGTISILGSNGIARTGYTFAGWTVAPDNSGTVMNSGYGLTVGSSNITVYAKWNPNTYTVTFLANGASGTPSATSATYTTGGTGITLPTVGTMAKTGNSFSGWSTTSNGTPLTSPYTTAIDQTLVAVWTPINYTITYVANGGSSTPTQAALPMGQTFSLASAITKPNGSSGEVYAFTGWSDGTSTYQAGNSYVVNTSNITFTAQWVRVYEVNYVLNGATSAQPANQLKNDGDIITLASAPTRSGYTFQGWQDQSGQSFTAGQTNYTVGLLHYTLNAIWSAINYTITYDPNGGSTTPQQGAKNIGQTFYLANAITRTGYTFNGWSDGSQTILPGAQILVGTSNLTFTAQWTADIYTITYDLNGGTGTAIPNATYTYGSSAITLPLVGDRIRTNYTFGGWSTTNNGSTVGLTYTPTGSATLYAVWTLNQYTITFNGNAANVSNTSATYTAGSSALTLPTVTRAGFVFKGWYSASSNGSLIGQAGATYTPSTTGSIYAQWTQLSLSGVNEADLSLITTANASASIGMTSTFTTSNSSVSVTIPAGALPASTVVTYNLLASNAVRAVSLPSGSSYILSLVVSWVAPDGTVPTTATGKPIVMTVSSSSIKKGASVYAIAGSSIQFLGVATQDGSVSVNITDDPEVAIVKTKPGAPTNVSATNGLDASTVVSWSAPSSDGGDAIANYTVFDNSGNTVCVTSSLSCAVNGLTNGSSYTFTAKAANAVGFSDASTPSAAITPVSPTPVVTPPSNNQSNNQNNNSNPPVVTPSAPERPAAPVTPAKPPLQIALQEITNIQSTSAHANVVVKWPGKAFTVEVCATISGTNACEQSKKFVVSTEDQLEKLPTGDYLLSADFNGLQSSGRYAFTATMATEDQQSASEMRSIKTPSGITLVVPATINSSLNSNLTLTVFAQNVTGYVKSWNAVGLPSGLRISKNAASLVITGIAKTTGTYFVDVTASDTDKGVATTRFVLNIAGAVAPAVIIKSATMQPQSISTSTVSWIASANGTFEVMYEGKSICKTTSNSCAVKDLLGPLSRVQVVVRDSAGAINFSTAAVYVSPVKPIEVGSAKFALNSSVLVTAQKKSVEKLAAILQAKGFTQIVVSGYADNTGSKSANAKISTDRAKNTYAYLNSFLASKPLSVTLSGKASTNPIASNATEAGRAANRRAVVSIS